MNNSEKAGIDAVNVICFGEVLIDNFPDGKRIGGAPLNVCYHLNKNGIRSQMVSQVGEDNLGKELLNGIQKLDVDIRYIDKTNQYPTSTVEVHVDDRGHVSYDIVEPVAWDSLEYDSEVASAISTATAFVFGSLSARNKQTLDTLFKYLMHAKWSVFDVNLRPPFYTKELVLELMSECQTLKVNEEELEILAEWLGEEGDSRDEALDLLLDHYPNILEILLTMGAKGALYKSREEKICLPVKIVKVKDTVGSGDSFLAAFLVKKIQGFKVQEALEHAIRISAFVATQHGACPDYEDLTE